MGQGQVVLRCWCRYEHCGCDWPAAHRCATCDCGHSITRAGLAETLDDRENMMAGDTQITITGNLVDDPELRFTPSGQPVAKFRIASTPRYFDKASNSWKDGDSLFLTVNVWRQAAENVAESMTRGTRAIVTGRLRQRSYETREGEKRTVYEIEADEVGPSLRNAAAKVNKSNRSTAGLGGGSGGSAGQGGYGGNAGARATDDPWAGEPGDSGFSDEPPF
jgi:single-strand DNA-binding protein